MSKSVHNNAEVHVEEISDHVQGSGEQGSHHMPPNFGQMPPISPELANNIGDQNYWPTLAAELMKRTPQLSTETLLKRIN